MASVQYLTVFSHINGTVASVFLLRYHNTIMSVQAYNVT